MNTTPEKIKMAVSSIFFIDLDQIMSRTRKREVSDARKAIVYFLRRYFKMSSNDIAKQIKRSHCVVDYMYKGAETLIKYDAGFKAKVGMIESVSKLKRDCCPTCGREYQ